MAALNSKAKPTTTEQKTCIDLPGEEVECWRSSDNIQVVLRKHRDVIFEINLGKEQKYTIESTGSDFYNANEKKLVPGKSVGHVFFNNGDRLHLWISRDFRGEMLLKSAGKLMMRFEPGKLDAQQYGQEPKTKPVPIIIALGSSSKSSDMHLPKVAHNAKITPVSSSPNTQPIAATIEEDCALVCIVDGAVRGMPDKIRKMIKNVEDKAQLIDLNPEDVITKNWLLTQLAGVGAYVGDNWEWLRASLDNKRHDGFRLVKAKIHYYNGKARYVFSGYSKYNTVFGRGAFGPRNDRIVSIFGGAGSAGSMASSTFKGVAGTFKSNALVSFIFGSALAVAEWKADVSKDGYDLAASLIMNVVKAIVSAALTVIIVTCIVLFIMFLIGASLSVVAVGAITIGVGVAAGLGIDVLDKKLGKAIVNESNNDGHSAVLAERMRQNLLYHWDYLKKKVLWDYEEMSL